MSLASGTRLGPHEIVAPIGAGGMGEVYRAKDTNLDRDVAIKVLPESFALDADRVARFAREAKTLAALNHPNIAAIHGLEKTPALTAIVMELVEGEDLSVIIARGPIPFADALPIARQIADALEAAHEQGIVHRDLKPQNIKVRADGTVKVLDFGLAKALDANASGAAADAMHSPTLTNRATQMGTIIGTAAYMAPEQARGRAVDRRADIWAFGVVLYEMLAGRRAFEGEDISITLANVLKEDVKWDALPEDLPARLPTLLRRCLERDPKRRLSWIGEARLVLDAPMADAAAPAAARSARSSAGSLAWLAATIVIAAITGAIVWQARAPKPAREERLAILSPTLSPPQAVAISPDATAVAIVADDKIWLRRLNDFHATEVTGTEGARTVFWSHDSAQVGFQARGKLWRVTAPGGAPIAIGGVPTDFTPAGAAAWASDGRIVFATGTSTLMQMPADGSAPASAVFALDLQKDVDIHEPSLLPDGTSVLFTVHAAPGLPYQIQIFADGVRRPVFTGTNRLGNARYAPTGHLLFEMNGGVWAAPFSLETKSTTADPALVADSARGPSVADDGTIVMLSGTASTSVLLTEVDAGGKPGAVIGKRRAVSPRLSPDGRSNIDPRTDADLWVLPVRGAAGDRKPFVFLQTPFREAYGSFSPDGQWVAYHSNESGRPEVYVRPFVSPGATGPAAGGQSQVSAAGGIHPMWRSDGKELYFLNPDGAMMAASITVTGDSLDPGAPVMLFPTRIFGGGADIQLGRQYDVAADGRFLVNSVSNEAAAPITLLQNWNPAAKR